MNTQKFFQDTLKNGGATLGHTNPTQGYFVSIKNHEQVIDVKDFTLEVVNQYVEKSAELLDKNYNFLGAWIEKDKVYLDISQLFLDKHQALTIAMEQQQRAIYDISKDKVINLPTPQKSGTYTQQRAYLRQKIEQLCRENS